jgi:hypothetical protein
MFTLFYFSIYYYPSKLKDSIFNDDYFYIATHIAFHIISFSLFLTAGKNPGFVDETDTVQSRKEKAKLFIGYDNFYSIEDSSSSVADTDDNEA